MEKQHCKNAIEAVGMVGRRQAIHNKLNQVRAHTDDPEFEALVTAVIWDFQHTSTNPDHTSIRDMNSCRKSANALIQYCEKQLEMYRQG